MKKKILIIVLIIIIIAIGVVGYNVYKDIKQEENLKTELAELEQLANAETIDLNAINERLDRVVTTDDYAVVEEAFKSYLRENFENSIKIANILNDERITTLLTAQNYKEDGKDFTQSKNYITTTKAELEDCKTKYIEFFTEEKAMSYINNKGLDSYYTDLYKNEFVGDIEGEETVDTVENSINEVISILDTSEKILNLLSENQNSWEIQGENISFNNESLSNQYDSLINSL